MLFEQSVPWKVGKFRLAAMAPDGMIGGLGSRASNSAVVPGDAGRETASFPEQGTSQGMIWRLVERHKHSSVNRVDKRDNFTNRDQGP